MNIIKLYTDGGCRGNQNKTNIGAWGVYMEYKGYEKELSGGCKNTTNNKMELTSVIEGLKTLKRKDLPVIVCVDSQYVHDGITKWLNGWKKKGWKTANGEPVKNKELWVELDSLVSSFKDIKFKKVKGHSEGSDEDSVKNRRVDKLCNDWMDRFGHL